MREGEKEKRRGREEEDIEVLVHRHRSNTDNLHLEIQHSGRRQTYLEPVKIRNPGTSYKNRQHFRKDIPFMSIQRSMTRHLININQGKSLTWCACFAALALV
jgi:hypothetical protein